MIERARAGITERVRGFADKYHLPLLHKHTRECSEKTRDFFLSLQNRCGELDRLQRKFEGATQLDLEVVRGDIWDPENHLLNQAYLELPNLGFIPKSFEEEFVRSVEYANIFNADVILTDEAIERVSPHVRRFSAWAHGLKPGFVHLSTNGSHDSPVIPSTDVFSGATLYLERRPMKGKFEGERWVVKIGQAIPFEPVAEAAEGLYRTPGV